MWIALGIALFPVALTVIICLPAAAKRGDKNIGRIIGRILE